MVLLGCGDRGEQLRPGVVATPAPKLSTGRSKRDAKLNSAPIHHFFYGVVSDGGSPVPGAQVSFFHGAKAHSLTVFTDDQGRYLTPTLPYTSGYSVRVRRVGWEDGQQATAGPVAAGSRFDFELKRHRSEYSIAAQLPANQWFHRVLQSLDEPERSEFKQQCTYCHQQGTLITRRDRSAQQWRDVIHQMALRGAIISHKLRDQLPAAYAQAYGTQAPLPLAEHYRDRNGPLPVPSLRARRAVIEEWELGEKESSQHDLMFYAPGNNVWSVDGPLDSLHRLDFSKTPDGDRTTFRIPHGDLEPGGVYRKMKVVPGQANTYLSPHSLQTAPDGRIWLTLASGNQLGGFDPKTGRWDMVTVEDGINPHTLRFDAKGRIWYTLTATNQVGMYDPLSGAQRFVRLPSPDWSTEAVLRMMPVLVDHADWFDLAKRGARADGVKVPMAYGIDISPVDGSVWYSQLNFSHIGRIDPESLEVTSIKTPFATPRRLRFDSQGGLWVPSYVEGALYRYDVKANSFRRWQIPIEPEGSATPYAVAIEPGTDHVWLNGTQSDSLIRFVPETESFTVYPMPTLVTYTREIDFDRDGRVWTSHSSFPAWHSESPIPKLSRIDPDGAPDVDSSGVFQRDADTGAPSIPPGPR